MRRKKLIIFWGGGSSEKPGAILTPVKSLVQYWLYLSESTSTADSLTCVCAAPVCNHMHQHQCTLKIPSTGSHTTVWTHGNTVHTDKNGQRCSCGCCVLPRESSPNFPCGTMKDNNEKHHSSASSQRHMLFEYPRGRKTTTRWQNYVEISSTQGLAV